jgi:Ca-activated chloride channel family protein
MRPKTLAFLLISLLLFAPGLAAQSDEASVDPSTASANAVAPASPPASKVGVGELLTLELQESLHTSHSQSGDHVHFTTLREVVVNSKLVVPAGSSVRATLTQVKKPGRRSRPGQIALEFNEIILPDGTTLPFEASVVRAGFTKVSSGRNGTKVKGEGGANKGDMITVAVGAGQGALIGASIGGGKGAAYGSAVGAGIGLLEILMRKGPHLDLPRGMLFEVSLDTELAVPDTAVAHFNQPGFVSQPSSAASRSTSGSGGGFRFPPSLDPDGRPDEVPIPDFPDYEEEEPVAEEQSPAEAETTTIAVSREPLPPAATPAEPPEPAAPPVLGPPPPPEEEGTFRLKVDVRLVMVEAVVRDDDGRVIENLIRQDFRLFEDDAEQQITHFSRDELPLAVALVVDRSGSVAPFMPELRRAAYQTLSHLKRGDEVALFSFDSDVDRLVDLTTDRRRIAERIARIRAGGGTNINDALATAVHYLSAVAPDRRRAIILISDNHATTRGFASQGDVIRRALETESVIYGVKTPGNQGGVTGRLSGWLGGLGSVRKITGETGGEVIDVRRVGSLQAALSAVVSRLKTRYTLGYNSTNKERDGAFRRIEVQLADQHGRVDKDYNVYARTGYYAPDERRASAPSDSR